MEWLAVTDCIAWVDVNGDTVLFALLKYWSYEHDELQLKDMIMEMVRLGAQIDMRDRQGDTALAIAARRGLRPALLTLIDSGASIHSRNCRGTGSLRQTRKSLRREEESGDDKLYAMVLSCLTCLLDLKALDKFSIFREF